MMFVSLNSKMETATSGVGTVTSGVGTATSGVGTADPSRAPEFIHVFLWDSCCSIFSFLCGSMFVFLSFFFSPLYFLPLFRSPITPLVSSNFS